MAAVDSISMDTEPSCQKPIFLIASLQTAVCQNDV